MNSFGTQITAQLAGKSLEVFSLPKLEEAGYNIKRLPYAHRILLENLLRHEDGRTITKNDIEALINWDPKAEPSREIAFTPARVLLQDFTGVPCVVDLASMRDAVADLGGDPDRINPLQPVELVIDHSVQVDAYGNESALEINLDMEYERNKERYEFLKWGQHALKNFRVVPPNTGICHQVNLEYLARVVFEDQGRAYLDTLVGTDSHTTMINGLGVLGWGVGGIEAEAAMLGQPIGMLMPQVVGFRLTGQLPEGATATDLVLTVTEMLRKHGVVGKFVEFYGPGIANMPLANRATIGNMAPEYGATCGMFPVDEVTLSYLRMSGRTDEHVQLVRDYFIHQGLFHTPDAPEAEYSAKLELDLSTVNSSVAGPKRPQDRALLEDAKKTFTAAFPEAKPNPARLSDGSIVLAAITSCTNTSNPSVMVAAGLVARKAAALGLKPKPWVKPSLAPGSRVVTEYLEASGLLTDLEAVGFNLVGYGCTTCIGNSGPLPEAVATIVREEDFAVVSVLSGNRNFEGRINQDVKANYLMSPPLVVAYSFAGTIDIDLTTEPVATTEDGREIFLKDIWPSQQEIAETIEKFITREMYTKNYATVFDGDEKWQEIEVTGSTRYDWQPDSTYVKQVPFFEGMPRHAPDRVQDFTGLKCLAKLGDSVTTDHISPAGAIKANSPAGMWLIERGVTPHLFNSYGSRRGHDEVMVRGTFANIRLRNQLAPGTEGGFTTDFLTGEVTTIYEAAENYKQSGIGLVILAGKEYGTGSSRDWAAKGTRLLGVKVVIAESFERIHRSNLIGMGVLPLQFVAGQNADSLGLKGTEEFSIIGLSQSVAEKFANGKILDVRATDDAGHVKTFEALCRLDTLSEVEYYRHGGVLEYVLRGLLN